MPFIEFKCNYCYEQLVTVVNHKGTLKAIKLICGSCKKTSEYYYADNTDTELLHNVGACSGCGKYHNVVEYGLKKQESNINIKDDEDRSLTIDNDPIETNDDGMADFIMLGGQMDSEALADYDDCSNG